MNYQKTKDQPLDDIVPAMVQGLGGASNIAETENCFTRLRVVVKDPALVNAETLECLGCYGVLQKGTDVHLVYGASADRIEKNLRKFLEKK